MCLEMSQHMHSSFLTLTYSDDMRPGQLDYGHIQRFLKALRKSTPTPVRFFCCGEFGKRTEREHWHLALFNSPFTNTGAQLIEQWPHGGAHCADLNEKSAAYTARYSLKTGVKGGEYVVNASRKPGIGLTAIAATGAYVAAKAPRIEAVPSWWRMGKRLYPLCRTGRLRFGDAYEAAGGHLMRRDYSPLSLDREARSYAINCDPTLGKKQSIEIERLERAELERGAAF